MCVLTFISAVLADLRLFSEGVSVKSSCTGTRHSLSASKNTGSLKPSRPERQLCSLVCPSPISYGSADRLRLPQLDYLADSVDAFLTSSPPASPTNPPVPGELYEDPPALPLGLTFSFPVEQTALDQGYLLTWTKGFAAKNAIGKDVVKLLQDAFDRKHLHVQCVAIVNDVRSPCLPCCIKLTFPAVDRGRAPLSCIHGWRLHTRLYFRHWHQWRVR